MRFALLFASLSAGGCTTALHRHDWPAHDRDRERVRQALSPTMEPTFERHVRGDGRAVDPLSHGATHNCGGQSYWVATFALRAPSGAARDLTPEEGRRILTGVCEDVRAAIEKAGPRVVWASGIRVDDRPNPDGRFTLFYSRTLADGSGEVQGEVVGKLTPCPGPGEPFSQVRVTLNERSSR